jgi:hypothetical protein
MGTGTNITRKQIKALPSIGGNIQDLMRLDPRVTFIDRASARSRPVARTALQLDQHRRRVGQRHLRPGRQQHADPRQPVAMEPEALDINLSNYDVSIAVRPVPPSMR